VAGLLGGEGRSEVRVTGGLTLVTHDGVAVRLDGLAPDVPMATLERLVAGADQVVSRGPDARDRTGHRRGEVFRSDGRSLQEHLVAGGDARVWPGVTLALARRLLALEDAARDARRGGWGDGRFRVHAAIPPPPVAGFAIVRGTVVSVGETRHFHYLNFEQDYWRDFSVRLRPRDVGRGGWLPEPESLVGARVEVRGFVFESGGPMIEVDGPLQLRVLD